MGSAGGVLARPGLIVDDAVECSSRHSDRSEGVVVHQGYSRGGGGALSFVVCLV